MRAFSASPGRYSIFHSKTALDGFALRPAQTQEQGRFRAGGVLTTLADRALGMTACKGHLSRSQATVQLDMHFMRTAKIGNLVEMECRVLRETRSLIFPDGERYSWTAKSSQRPEASGRLSIRKASIEIFLR